LCLSQALGFCEIAQKNSGILCLPTTMFNRCILMATISCDSHTIIWHGLDFQRFAVVLPLILSLLVSRAHSEADACETVVIQNPSHP
jgi:hypothetical protein